MGAHERSEEFDILAGLLKQRVKEGHDVRVIVMSATMDTDVFVNFFKRGMPDSVTNGLEEINIPGRPFDVDVYYSRLPVEDYISASAAAALRIHFQEDKGVFWCFYLEKKKKKKKKTLR
eukprot:NODE_3528_length_393_cov_236.531977_g2977_i0.p1 GENE.NODE_3528_length_393_cov_236.531977_g2977_i0~~NODE_3528_length_393_cov_236.531977_g2977_i0.p1  ORF type:complete len:119 (+),score=38.49 NODE_3528_length_393_cov_236.531977_g2977_i0:33-389(+)